MRIKELGGADYKRISAKIYDTQGIEHINTLER